ncbi:uncharacterized protein LOC132030157 [Lycium ferocissimum]|uniref:uncharacterized protein LOC132030157 n=1 Tax=Lycium ferocissimum TaxID=112874 RepID=UPI0028149AF5|nr:uncharacterized protein LOC132030157 [Lycium ferocissimum]
MIEKKRVQILVFLASMITLSMTAGKCRDLVGQEAASKSGQFRWWNCFDGGSGTIGCAVKEGVKLYFYNSRSSHVDRVKNLAIKTALSDAISQGLTTKDATKLAQKEGEKAAKTAVGETKRVIGPTISAGWDFFEALYFGGTSVEGFLRSLGTLLGTHWVGYLGEHNLGRFGYMVGSQLGSWVGGTIGLMVYDLVNGVEYMLELLHIKETEVNE